MYADWMALVDKNTNGRCVMEVADKTHHCDGVAGRRKLEHHHVLTRGAYPAEKYSPLNGILCCPSSHDMFHEKGLEYTVSVIRAAKIYDVINYVCSIKKGLNDE